MDNADNDLEDIFDYSIEQFGFARAEQYIVDIEQAFKELAANPNPSLPRRGHFGPVRAGMFQVGQCDFLRHLNHLARTVT